MGFVEVFAVGIGVLVLSIVWRIARYDLDRDTRSWAAAYGVTLTPTNVDFVRTYLRTGRRLRFVCAAAGFLLPPLVIRAVDPTSGSGPSIGGLIAGYMVGSLWAELSLNRSTSGEVRVAALAPRRLEEYLPGRLRWGLWVVAGAACAMGVGALFVDEAVDASFSTTGPRWAPAVVGITCVLLASAVEAAQRWILRRPQPFVAPDLLIADDAVRSSSIHALAGSGICSILLLAIVPAFVLAGSDVQLLRWTMPWVGLAAFIGALISIRYYAYRAWRVRRPRPTLVVAA